MSFAGYGSALTLPALRPQDSLISDGGLERIDGQLLGLCWRLLRLAPGDRLRFSSNSRRSRTIEGEVERAHDDLPVM